MRRRFTWFALVCVALLMVPLTLAQDVRIPPEQIDSLTARVTERGDLPVIVTLALSDYRPYSQLNATQAQAQRAQLNTVQGQVLSSLNASDYAVNDRYKYTPALALTVNQQALRALARDPNVVRIQEDIPVPSTLNSSLDVIEATTLGGSFDQGYRGNGYAVAILDSGVQFDHPMFSDGVGGDRVIAQACFNTTVPSNNSTSFCPNGLDTDTTSANAGQDCNETEASGCEHGTHVAGIAAGDNRGHTGTQYYGVAPEADVIAVNVFSKFNDVGICGALPSPCILSYFSDQIAGLEYVYDLVTIDGIPVASANMSLGGGRNTSTCDGDTRKPAIDNLLGVNVATVIASGNDNYRDAVGAPGCISTAVTVGATTDADSVASFSNVYADLDLFAPGVNIVSSTLPDDYESYNGTSMATPHVAGAWAVMRERYPSYSVAQILTRLQDTGTLIDDNRSSGTVQDIPRLSIGDATLSSTPVNTDVKINELLASDVDMIELYNTGGTSIDVSGWEIYVDGALFYTIPSSTTIAAGDYLTLIEGSNGTDSATIKYIGANITWTTSGSAALLDGGGVGVDFVRFGSNTDTPPAGTTFSGTVPGPSSGAANESIARDASSTDTDASSDWSIQTPTPHNQNLGVLVSNSAPTLLINEVYLGGEDAIELYNYGTAPVNVTGFQLWGYFGDRTDVIYTLPAGSTIQPGAYVILSENSGANTAFKYYMNAPLAWDSGSSGAVTLTFGETALDFVRFGSSVTVGSIPGTTFSGRAPTVTNATTDSIARDDSSTDTDTDSDWTIRPESLGLNNSGTISIADGDVAGLISAIESLNTSGVGGTIELATNGTYTLTSVYGSSTGLPIINSAMTIDGNGATIQRDTSAPNFRIFFNNAATLTLTDMTLANGVASGYGGAIESFNDIVLTNVNMSNSSASIAGGAIDVFGGDLQMQGGTIDGNSAAVGGGINLENATGTINGTTLTNNTATDINNAQGGAMRAIGDSNATATNVTVRQNNATYGGAVYVRDSIFNLTGGIYDDNQGVLGAGIYTDDTGVSPTSLSNTPTVTIDGRPATLAEAPMPAPAASDDQFSRTMNFDAVDAATAMTIDGVEFTANGDQNTFGTAIYNFLGDLTINNTCITGHTNVAVSNQDSRFTLNATNNWWGSSNGPSGVGTSLAGDHISAGIDASSYLTTRPANCDSNPTSPNRIRGEVRDSASTTPIEAQYVFASSQSSNWQQFTCTNPSGYYNLHDVPLGEDIRISAGTISQTVCAGPTSYAREYYDDVYNPEDASDVLLTSGTPIVQNIDFNLSQTGTITADVTDLTQGTAPAAISVLFEYGGVGFSFCTTTGSQSYAVPYGEPVDVTARTSPACSMASYVRDESTGNIVTSASPNLTVNLGVTPGGTISGFVRDTASNGLSNVSVVEDLVTGESAISMSPTGAYTVYGIPFDVPVKLRAGDTGSGYGYEWWNDQTTQDGGQTITVTAGSPSATGYDFTLNTAGTISGRVTLGGTPIANVPVQVDGYNGASWSCTDSNGDYMLENVANTQTYSIYAGGNTVPCYRRHKCCKFECWRHSQACSHRCYPCMTTTRRYSHRPEPARWRSAYPLA